jgi:DNA-binding transcriptional MerR regulator/methylmalonyl-CoA mutase cobalamin-binding subunit
MPKTKEIDDFCVPIAQVERDTGLTKDTLRVWERRYGFPTPARDDAGQRIYSEEQLQRLRLVKRLMDQGFRAGKVVPKEMGELQKLNAIGTSVEIDPDVTKLVQLLNQHSREAIGEFLKQRIAVQGLRSFVLDTVSPLTHAVGQLWFKGEIGVYEEHLWSEMVGRELRQSLGSLGSGAGATVLLTTLPSEGHGLGLLMAEVFFALAGMHCVSLGLQTPTDEIARAAAVQNADKVALSFSSAYPARALTEDVNQLRYLLPGSIELWVGGAGVSKRRFRTPGIHTIRDLEQLERDLRA